ncbi:glycoside hydrolase family 9 protein [Marinicellulosiphila megalodicopiae]|uniref:glycoside hydrolase family 9 protein n=1 Tax=Marinicellulosiphila megalodicopiae TaxID=2724896 RepID=UPI003BAEEED0
MKNFKKASLSVAIATLMVQPMLAGATPTLIENGDFANGSFALWETPAWWESDGSGTNVVDDQGRFCTTTTEEGVHPWSAQLRQSGRTFVEGETYKVSFNAWTSNTADVTINFGANDEAVGAAIFNEYAISITSELTDPTGMLFEMDYVAEASTDVAKIAFQMGPALLPVGETVCLDNVVVEPPAKNLLAEGDFSDAEAAAAAWTVGLDWDSTATTASLGAGTSEVDTEGRMCISITTTTAADWGQQLQQKMFDLKADIGLTMAFDVWSTADVTIAAGLNDTTTYTDLIGGPVAITARLDEPGQHFEFTEETNPASEAADFRFVLGANADLEGETVCFDNLELLDPNGNSVIQPVEPVLPHVTVNQVGYLPAFSKVATYKIIVEEGVTEDVNNARTWTLKDSADAVVTTGSTIVIGEDANSGDIIHEINFSDVIAEGSDYVLEVTEGTEIISSFPFDISTSIADQLQFDALAYFYHNRSGIEIEEALVGAEHARDAGHVGGSITVDVLDEDDMVIGTEEILYTDDRMVDTWACKADKEDDTSLELDETLPGCRIGVDVSGGWYDAGDHGKYVVNGGISVWTLMNQYERANLLGSNADTFGTDTLALPAAETANALPDLLDEAKYELDFFFKMQIPAGEDMAGMVYHKIHNLGWTGIPQLPSEDVKKRFIQPPTTAATLNVAATGAQCFRVFQEFDQAYADECLANAKVAYEAAKMYPTEYAGGANAAVINENGGGLYPDQQVADDFYWAAVELYLATGEAMYMNDIFTSPIHNRFVIDEQFDDADFEMPSSIFTWGQTNALGLLSMVTAGEAFNADATLLADAKELVLTAADNYAWFAHNPGYSVGMDTTKNLWGSNSFAVNNMILLGLASDITDNAESCYLDAFNNSMSYLLGNNPMNFSYVSGYGENALIEPHHRFWAGAVDGAFPMAPAGALSGGPNMGLEDSVASGRLEGCASEKCYLDDIDAWSVNEITVNWNAPMAWTAAYAADMSAAMVPVCSTDYSSMTSAPALTAKGQNDVNNAVDNDTLLIATQMKLAEAQAALELAYSDIEATEAELALAQAALATAQANLATAETALTTLQADATATEADLAAAEADLAAAEADLVTAEATITAYENAAPEQNAALSQALADLAASEARVQELEDEADAGSVPFIFAALLMFVAVATRRKRFMK